MTLKQVDYLNIGLMIISLVLAFKLPFELFLFSYAVLGPLHYLTEIGWLHKHQYYTKKKKDYFLIGFLCLLAFLSYMFSIMDDWEATASFANKLNKTPIGKFFSDWAISFIFLALMASIALAAFSKVLYRTIFIAIAIVASVLLHKNFDYKVIFGVFLPTIIHVSLFTLLFMLFGAMKSKLSTGYLSVGVYIICVILIFTASAKSNYQVGEYVANSYDRNGFLTVNKFMGSWFYGAKQMTYTTGIGLTIQRFIAFAYTYHYLNWFSKTNIIRWHEVPKRAIIISVSLWIVSVGLYAYDYKTGFIALILLSNLHVFLEFPLNYKSVEGIVTSLRGNKKAIS